jgi:N-acetylglucosamine kinase-like BadF-type ATPase
VALFLGIDGGGTKTVFALGDEQQVLATVITPGSNMVRLGAAAARTSLHQGLRQILVAASVSPDRIVRTYAGIGGAGTKRPAEKLRKYIADIIPGPIEVVGDHVVAHRAAFGDGSGVMVISGTGSIAYGRDASGRTLRAGGLGPKTSDEGSGHWVGLGALTLALRTPTSRRSLALMKAAARTWNLDGPPALQRLVKRSPSRDYSSLFPLVLAAARQGDAPCHRMLTSAGIVLAALAASVISKLFPEAKTVPVALSGGIFAHSPEVRETFRQELLRFHTHAALDPTPVDPVCGALELARAAS